MFIHTWLNRMNSKFRASSLYCAFTAQWFQLSDIRFTSLADTIIFVNSNSTIKLNKWIVQTHDIKTHSLCFSFFASLPLTIKNMFQFSSCLKFDFLMPFSLLLLVFNYYYFFSLISILSFHRLMVSHSDFFNFNARKKSFEKDLWAFCETGENSFFCCWNKN